MHILESDYDNYMLLYSCVENMEYRDSETGRPISQYEMSLKANLSPVEYLKHIADDVEWWDKNGPKD